MVRQWATVRAWRAGIAILVCDTQRSCRGCQQLGSCGSSLLNRRNGGPVHQMQMAIEQPLSPGQRVEIGVAEASLLRSALLVYMSPLVGGISLALFIDDFLNSDLAAVGGAIVGGLAGFLLAKRYALRLQQRSAYRPILLKID